jgi:hypothetical protein
MSGLVFGICLLVLGYYPSSFSDWVNFAVLERSNPLGGVDRVTLTNHRKKIEGMQIRMRIKNAEKVSARWMTGGRELPRSSCLECVDSYVFGSAKADESWLNMGESVLVGVTSRRIAQLEFWRVTGGDFELDTDLVRFGKVIAAVIGLAGVVVVLLFIAAALRHRLRMRKFAHVRKFCREALRSVEAKQQAYRRLESLIRWTLVHELRQPEAIDSSVVIAVLERTLIAGQYAHEGRSFQKQMEFLIYGAAATVLAHRGGVAAVGGA